MNDSLSVIGGKLKQANSILIFPHVNLDGDAVGSSAALCAAMRNAGKESSVLIAEEVPENLRFLDQGYFTTDETCIGAPDVCICLDCGEPERFPDVKEQFAAGKTRICLDHHATSRPFADYNHIDKNRAATAELMFSLLKEMEVPITTEIGEAIFAGIATDTGNFQYSNTTKETHLIAAQLYDAKINVTKIAAEIYQSVRLERIKAVNLILDHMEIFADGRGAIAYVTGEMLKQAGADISETDGVVETLRNIKGVEIAVFVKEKTEDIVKVSMRAKQSANVMEIASKFQGGGHIKAAGCTLHNTVSEAVRLLKEEVEKSLEK